MFPLNAISSSISWVNGETGEVLENISWKVGQPNGMDVQQCTYSIVGAESDQIFDGSCWENYCFMCSFPTSLGQPKPLTLRGLPENTVIDQYFSIMLDKPNVSSGYYQFQVLLFCLTINIFFIKERNTTCSSLK